MSKYMAKISDDFDILDNGDKREWWRRIWQKLDGTQSYGQCQKSQVNGAEAVYSADGQDMNSTEYWERLYPGWKYDQNTEQWYQVDGYDEKAALTLMFIIEQRRFLLATNLSVWCRDNTAKWYLKQSRATIVCQTRIRFRQVIHSLNNQVTVGGSIYVLNLMEVVSGRLDGSCEWKA
ncbi:hypothetical protein POM88_008375 [Heracleum sosnowskyi]|uniref:Uncharacterized protein n=1 Tax=Heracleum sosnowskyi TaxID=360622 RepID=A0AAD8J6A0_9APIA|nr:hypothetical protein POM88_008375 [Heracleum sosnowskyi]